MTLDLSVDNREKQRDILDLQTMIQKHLKIAIHDLSIAESLSELEKKRIPARKEVDYWLDELHKIRSLLYPAPALAKLESLERRGLVNRY